MALKKAKQINRDVTANHWVILSYNYDKESLGLSVCLGLYTSKASRTDGDDPIRKENIQIYNVNAEDLEENIWVYIYDRLKTDSTIFPVLVSEAIPEVSELDNITGEKIIITEYVPAVYKSFFEDAIDD